MQVAAYKRAQVATLGSMSLPERVTVDPLQCDGRPCIRGMRIRVSDLLGLLGEGESENEILADFPDLEREDLLAALLYAARYLDYPRLSA